MATYEEGLEAITRLALDEIDQSRNEATTRLHLIDRLLFDCLGWERGDCQSEQRIEGEYSDYAFYAPHRSLVVEAKREGSYFELPAGQLVSSPHMKLKYFEKNYRDVYAAIQQCQAYCAEGGTAFGAVSNGHQVVAFLAARLDGVAPLDGEAIVFESLDDMRQRFKLLWNTLSKPGVQAQGLTRELASADQLPPPPKLSASIPNYPGYRIRNQLQGELQVLGDLIIEDVIRIVDNEREFLEHCYCSSGALSQYSLVSRSILEARYTMLDQSDGIQLAPAATKRGINPEVLQHSISRRPILLVGDIGVGKTMFIRQFIQIDAKDVFEHAIALYLDMGTHPALGRDLPRFVASEITRQLRDDHGIDVEDAAFVRRLYDGELKRFARSVYGELRVASPDLFAQHEREFLISKAQDSDGHLRAALAYITSGMHKQVVLFMDNLDQRFDDLQQEAFLIGNAIADSWPVAVFISLRPETFHRSRSSGALSAYHAKAFTISPPRLDLVIQKRLGYAIAVAESGRLGQLGAVAVKLTTVVDYMRMLLQSFEQRPDLQTFCDNMCGGNIRLALDFIRTFIGSGHVDTQKILDIYSKSGTYYVSLHEFVRAVLYGDYQFYDPDRSEIMNLFDVESPDAREHFLKALLLSHLARAGETKPDAFVRIDGIYAFAQGLGYAPRQIHNALARCLARKLVERPARSRDEAEMSTADVESSHLRATSIGLYYLTELLPTFVYLDAVVVDTPILAGETRMLLQDVAPIDERCARARIFVDYLDRSWVSVAALSTLDWPSLSFRMKRDIENTRLSARARMPRTDRLS